MLPSLPQLSKEPVQTPGVSGGPERRKVKRAVSRRGWLQLYVQVLTPLQRKRRVDLVHTQVVIASDAPLSSRDTTTIVSRPPVSSM